MNDVESSMLAEINDLKSQVDRYKADSALLMDTLGTAMTAIQRAWWRLKNPDMGSKNVGDARDLLEEAKKEIREVLQAYQTEP